MSVKIRSLFFVLLLLSSGLFSYNSWWRVIPSSGFVGRRGGVSLGQTAVGYVASEDSTAYGNWGFWNNTDPIEICFFVEPDEWILDSFDVYYTVAMTSDEAISISNCSNCNIDLGLEFHRSYPIHWSAGRVIDFDQFVLRARFQHSVTAPWTYDHSHDIVLSQLIWATSEKYGPAGFDLPIGDTSLKLFFQLLLPISSSEWGANTIVVKLHTKMTLP